MDLKYICIYGDHGEHDHGSDDNDDPNNSQMYKLRTKTGFRIKVRSSTVDSLEIRSPLSDVNNRPRFSAHMKRCKFYSAT